MRILTFSLLDAISGEALPGYEDVTPGAGMLLTRSKLPRQVNIRADTEGEVSSVRWMWNGQPLRVTNASPHLAWEGGWIPPVGEGALTAMLHPGPDATGRSGGGRKLEVTVRQMVPAVKVVTATVTPASADNVVTLNPADAQILRVTGAGSMAVRIADPLPDTVGYAEIVFEQPPEGGFTPEILNGAYAYNMPPDWSTRPGQSDLLIARKYPWESKWRLFLNPRWS